MGHSFFNLLENANAAVISSIVGIIISAVISYLQWIKSRNNMAQQALAGNILRNSKSPYKVFRSFVQPTFAPIVFPSTNEQALSFKQLWKYITKQDAGVTGLFICGMPGKGKPDCCNIYILSF